MEKRGFVHRHSRPTSVKVLLGYVTFLLAFYLFHFIYDLAAGAATVFFGRIMTGVSALFVDGAFVVLLGFVLYGFMKRTSWSWPLAIVWFVVSIASAILSLVFVQQGLLFIVKDILVMAFAAAILVDGFVLWYIVYRKEYFMRQTVVLDAVDKFFIYALVSFWIIAILVMLTLGLRYYKITKSKADGIISELSGSDFQTAMSTCGSKAGFDKDICYTTVAILFPAEPKDEICSKAETDFYRVVCLKAT